MTAYYNEHDPYAAQWLRNLIAAGHVAPGEVDERSIEDVLPAELTGYTQCHFFAGIDVWSFALRRAGWPDDRPVWTGSCPCQPFSAAGQRGAFDDERHLWPAWHHLITQRKPAQVFGEQVAAADGYAWLDLVQTDMEAAGYAFGPVVLPAAGVGAPHGRHRIFFVADADHKRLQGRVLAKLRQCADERTTGKSGDALRLADANMPEQDGGRAPSGEQPLCDQRSGCAGTMEHPESEQARVSRLARERRATGGHWADADWLPCQGGKWRPIPPIEPHILLLANGIAYRMGYVCADQVAKIEKEIIEHAQATGTNPRKEVLDVWHSFAEEAIQWAIGGQSGFHEATVLLAFMLKLKGQGWAFSESVPCASEEAEKIRMRVLRGQSLSSRSSCGRGLDEQRTRESTNSLHILSSVLARHAHQAWGDAALSYSRHAFPIASGVACRMDKLRAFGNAISPQVAEAFIGAYLDSRRWRDAARWRTTPK